MGTYCSDCNESKEYFEIREDELILNKSRDKLNTNNNTLMNSQCLIMGFRDNKELLSLRESKIMKINGSRKDLIKEHSNSLNDFPIENSDNNFPCEENDQKNMQRLNKNNTGENDRTKSTSNSEKKPSQKYENKQNNNKVINDFENDLISRVSKIIDNPLIFEKDSFADNNIIGDVNVGSRDNTLKREVLKTKTNVKSSDIYDKIKEKTNENMSSLFTNNQAVAKSKNKLNSPKNKVAVYVNNPFKNY